MTSPAATAAESLTPERLARIGLLQLAPPTRAVLTRIADHGIERVAAVLREAALASGRSLREPEAECALAEQVGARFVMPGDPEWPPGLHALSAFTARAPTAADRAGGRDMGVPFGLWVRGPLSLADTCQLSAAVVGARAATGYGEWVAAELGTGLAERGVSVVSGAAFGIDASAHRGALAIAGVTVAVLAGGVDRPYPTAHEQLLARIAADGLVVSEAPFGAAPRREAFLRRNRLIAALSGGVVLVEAGLRSGARNTVAHARALDRPRMAVPGPITSALSAGCHALLREDPEARLVTGPADVLEEIGRIGHDLSPAGQGSVDARDALSVRSRRVLDALPAHASQDIAALAGELGVEQLILAREIRLLVSTGLLVREGDSVRLTPAARAPTTRTTPRQREHTAQVAVAPPGLWPDGVVV